MVKNFYTWCVAGRAYETTPLQRSPPEKTLSSLLQAREPAEGVAPSGPLSVALLIASATGCSPSKHNVLTLLRHRLFDVLAPIPDAREPALPPAVAIVFFREVHTALPALADRSEQRDQFV
eukprot:CAMPEP_0178983402 /NCGR_PEP_ID=MMETSP0795-20121207/1039_1 /TAXON_ID=88552 /ORGANISM="Amoebophrya sp., Strain Ameob2" /LENGTH=120 /DNA_ID=CAMNT_0020674169 /DNA_START=279 /DNA_END=639 /DNA_ORIENTATION=-